MNMERIPLEEWKAKKLAERQAVREAQDAALEEIISDDAKLIDYWIGHGRLGTKLSCGNAALILKSCPDAVLAHTMQGWRQRSVYIRKGEHGTKILTRKNGYVDTETVFTDAQTSAKNEIANDAAEEARHWQEGSIVLHLTADAFARLSPVPVEETQNARCPVEYLFNTQKIVVDPSAPDTLKFQYFPMALVHAYMDESKSWDLLGLYSLGVSYELCGRFFVEPPDREVYAEVFPKYRALLTKENARETLNDIRRFSDLIGNSLEVLRCPPINLQAPKRQPQEPER